MNLDTITIREYSASDSLEQLTDLLHRSYKPLSDLGLKYLATHQSADTTKERIERGTCFVAESKKKIIGLINYYPPTKKDKEGWIESAWMGQFAVDPEFQKKGIGKLLVRHVEQYALTQGNESIALDTAEPATHLIDWYKKLGYHFYGYINWDITNYRSVIMIKKLQKNGLLI